MATIEVTLFDGSGKTLARPKQDILLSVRDGRQTSFHRTFVKGPTVGIQTMFHNDPRDAHVVLASMKGHRDAGFMPVTVTETGATAVDLMLLPRAARYAFASAPTLGQDHAALHGLLERTFGPGRAPAEFEKLQAGGTREPLACLANIIEALDVVPLAGERQASLVDYIAWLDLANKEDRFRRDRFFAWVDADLKGVLDRATHGTSPLFHKATAILHRGATASYKQAGFGEANVQVTLHEKDGAIVDGRPLIQAEFDIDYFKDEAAHLLLEVFPNHLKRFVLGPDSRNSLTDPAVAYGLRWMAGRRAKGKAQTRPFAPAFTIASA